MFRLCGLRFALCPRGFSRFAASDESSTPSLGLLRAASPTGRALRAPPRHCHILNSQWSFRIFAPCRLYRPGVPWLRTALRSVCSPLQPFGPSMCAKRTSGPPLCPQFAIVVWHLRTVLAFGGPVFRPCGLRFALCPRGSSRFAAFDCALRYRLQDSFAHWTSASPVSATGGGEAPSPLGLLRAASRTARGLRAPPHQFPLKSYGFPGAETAGKRFLLWKMGFSGAACCEPMHPSIQHGRSASSHRPALTLARCSVAAHYALLRVLATSALRASAARKLACGTPCFIGLTSRCFAHCARASCAPAVHAAGDD